MRPTPGERGVTIPPATRDRLVEPLASAIVKDVREQLRRERQQGAS